MKFSEIAKYQKRIKQTTILHPESSFSIKHTSKLVKKTSVLNQKKVNNAFKIFRSHLEYCPKLI